jgi:hypothetical protein
MLLSVMAMCLTGCSLLTMEEIPSPELIKKWMGPFLIEADQIKGVYRNLDVDSLIFTYGTAVQTEGEFRNALSSALVNSRWQRSTSATDFIEFRRTFAKGDTSEDRPDMAMFASFELARLSFNPAERKVVVAYVQADTSKSVTRFEDTSEGEWAERVIWPKFNELRKK